MATLFSPPTVYGLPLSKGGDLVIDFMNKVPGSNPATYTDYPAGVTLTLIIDTDVPARVNAVINGSLGCRFYDVAVIRFKKEWFYR